MACQGLLVLSSHYTTWYHKTLSYPELQALAREGQHRLLSDRVYNSV